MKEEIEDYFNGKLTEAEKKQFESELASDQELAEDASFYLKAKIASEQIAHDSLLKEKHEQWNKVASSQKGIRRNSWIGVAAALLLFFSIGYFGNWFQKSINSKAEYIVSNNLKVIPVHLGEEEGTLPQAIDAYNEGKYEQSIAIANAYLNNNNQDPKGLEVLGLSQLQLKRYDEALVAFQKLTDQSQLISNPGKYYGALTYLLRGREEDVEKSKIMLEEVIKENLPGKNEAIKLLD